MADKTKKGAVKDKPPIKKTLSIREQKALHPRAYKKYKGGGMAGMRRFNRGGKV